MIRKDQQHSLSSLVGITAATTTLVLKGRKSGYSALKLLEIVGSVMVTPTIDRRSDLSVLRATNPELYHAFNSPQTQSDALAAIIHRSE